jgi:hypothetical protein
MRIVGPLVIEMTIRLGDILVVLGLVGTCMTIAFKAGGFTTSLDAMQAEITELKTVASTVADVLTTVAVQKNEIEHIRTDVDDLKRGRGFIKNTAP